jgi:hypothetical protein
MPMRSLPEQQRPRQARRLGGNGAHKRQQPGAIELFNKTHRLILVALGPESNWQGAVAAVASVVS